jgi:hypothetical protein
MEVNYSKHSLDVIAKREIKKEWIKEALENPSRIDKINLDEVHFYAKIIQNDNRCLKIVLNPLKNLIITVYFDRNMRKKGYI